MAEKTRKQIPISKNLSIGFYLQGQFLTSFYVVLFALLCLTFLLFYIFRERVYPNIFVANINLGSQNLEQAEERVVQKVTSFEKEGFILKIDNYQENFKPEDAGIDFNTKNSVKEAFRIGRDSNIFLAARQFLEVFFGKKQIEVSLDINEPKINEFLDNLSSQFEVVPLAATFSFNGKDFLVKGGENGVKLDKIGLKSALLKSSKNFSSLVVGQLRIVEPTVSETDVIAAQEDIKKIFNTKLTLRLGNKIWKLDKKQLEQFISLDSGDSSSAFKIKTANYTIEVQKIYSLTSPKSNPLVQINTAAVKDYVARITQEIDQPAINARFEFQGGRVANFVPHQEGREVDADLLVALISNSLVGEEKALDLPVKITSPAVTIENVNNLGIKELIGKGESKFGGSGEGRVHNIKLGSERLNGVLIAPGETFSMHKAIGDVEATTGFREAYIIINGRTQIGIGGGICQVSTTLFRAILNSGLPVVERHPHAYRVGYYELDSPPGVDASVYFPTSDLKFKNDTPNYLLIQRRIDLARSFLAFEIYGTSDGRRVDISKPIVKNLVAPPLPSFQEDVSLPAGTKKQVDFEAWGADTIFSRKIYKDGNLVSKEDFVTHYQPWRAIYLIGTGGEGI